MLPNKRLKLSSPHEAFRGLVSSGVGVRGDPDGGQRARSLSAIRWATSRLPGLHGHGSADQLHTYVGNRT